MERALKQKGIKNIIRQDLSGYKVGDPTKFYTLGEEILNSASHGLGSIAAIIGTAILTTLSVIYGTGSSVAISMIYGMSLIILYTMSTLYHAFPWKTAKKVFRVFDHTSIFILIAGTYTPFTLIALGGTWKGYAICALVWALAILGIVLNAINMSKFKVFSMILYVAMGWAVVLAMGDILAVMQGDAFTLLLGGGLAYTGGLVFYALKKIKYMHGVWHFFVLLGSVLHYICVVRYVMPMSYV